ncbi:MAG: ATP-dependent RNA helicase RhlE [Flavobacteriales bacterium]|jgi:ATP-dependent RNA helicase RhlE
MSFKSLGLAPALLETLEKQKFVDPTDIQKQAIPAFLAGKDVVGIAQTGSGKTASFVLPLLMKVVKNDDYSNRHIKALILAPTRELAIQVHQVIQLFSQNLDRKVKSMAVYGGVSINPQMIGMQNVEILVATPGRLLDLIENKALHLSEVSTFIMDEADKLLNLDFQEELEKILSLLPSKKQSLLYSATFNDDVQSIHELFLKNPTVINIEPDEESVDLIEQLAYKVTNENKGPFLRALLKEGKYAQVLIFTSSGKRAEQVAGKLSKNGITASPMHGKLSQGARTTALTKFKAKELQVLVVTDLLSRGIDIDVLPCVINYELPRSPKDYIHRIGRTGRAGASGTAISFVTEEEMHHFKVIMKKTGQWVDVIDFEIPRD